MIFFHLATAVGQAQDSDLKKSLSVRLSVPNNGNIRSHAAFPLDIDIEWRSERLLEGYVEITLREDSTRASERQTFFTYRTPELVLSLGSRQFNALLPSVALKLQGILTYDLKFVSLDGSVIDFGTQSLIAPTVKQRRLLVGVVLSDARIPESRTAFARFLRLEAIVEPDTLPRQLKPHMKDVITLVVRVPSDDLPVSANRLCTYDVLMFPEEAFQRLSNKQLAALGAWIEAGGRALIETTSSGHERSHVDFLNNLADSGASVELPFSINESGDVVLTQGDNDPLRLANAAAFEDGLGRAIVVNQPLSKWLDDSGSTNRQRLQTVGRFLWNTTAKVLPPNSTAAPTLNDLNTALMPASVRTVPVSSVVSMLVIFLLVISVGDYFLLGLINKRMLTWFLFPLVSLGFTWYTVNMARSYVGATDFTTGVTVIDTNQHGQVLRSSRFELLFTAAERESNLAIKNAVFSPITKEMRPNLLDEYDRYQYQRQNYFSYEDNTVSRGQSQSGPNFMRAVSDPPVCSGVLPGSFEVQRNMRKWTPQIARYTRLGSDQGPVPFPEFAWQTQNWQALLDSEKFTQWSASMQEKYPGAQFLAVSSGAKQSLIRSAAWNVDARWSALNTFIKSITVTDQSNVFLATRRLAPTGSSYLEDLPTVDVRQPVHLAVIAIIQQDEEFFVFRFTPTQAQLQSGSP